MSAAEWNLWISFRQHYGFDIDRQEWAVANGASAQCAAWGSRVKPGEIVARFAPSGPSKRKVVFSLAALPGAHVTFTPHDKTKPTLTGQAALAMLDEPDNEESARRTLSGEKRPEKPSGKRTLAGD